MIFYDGNCLTIRPIFAKYIKVKKFTLKPICNFLTMGLILTTLSMIFYFAIKSNSRKLLVFIQPLLF